MRLIIDAMNVHQGGGRALLADLLANLPDNLEVIALLDERLPLAESAIPVVVRRVPPTLRARVAAHRWLSRHARPDDRILCFGGLPPLFATAGQKTLFLQNRYLLGAGDLSAFGWRTKARIGAERSWLRARLSTIDRIVVQTPSMRSAVEAAFGSHVPVEVWPFMAGAPRPVATPVTGTNFSDRRLIYIASGEPHKNHRRLVEAWAHLATHGIRPRLDLTVGASGGDLQSWIEEQRSSGDLNIVNHGLVSPDVVGQLLLGADAAVYPSLFESFGLPMLEARAAGLPLIAPEADYVRDLLDPAESFDPQSSLSIARAVARFLKADLPRVPIGDAAGFLKALLKP